MERKAYPSDIRDEEWALVAPYLTLMTARAVQSGITPGGPDWTPGPNVFNKFTEAQEGNSTQGNATTEQGVHPSKVPEATNAPALKGNPYNPQEVDKRRSAKSGHARSVQSVNHEIVKL